MTGRQVSGSTVPWTRIGEGPVTLNTLAHPDSPYPVLANDRADRPPRLPEGHGAVALYAWCPSPAERYTPEPMVGVDGKPACRCWGEVFIVLPAGEHLVEVQSKWSMRTIQVTVAPGQLVPVEYAAALDGVSPGALGLGPQRPPGRASNPMAYFVLILVSLLSCVAGAVIAGQAGLSADGTAILFTVALVAAVSVGSVAVYRHHGKPGPRPERKGVR